MRGSPGRRDELAARLRARRAEIEQAMLARVHAVSDPGAVDDPEYAAGLRTAVSAALDYGIAAIEASEDRRRPVPPELLAQARGAARNGVSLDTVLRRYFAGCSLLSDFALGEADALGLAGRDLQGLLWLVSIQLDGLVAAVAEEYTRDVEEQASLVGSRQRLAERVRRMLGGEPLELADLRYELDAWHLGVIASGPGALEALPGFLESLDCQQLVVGGEEGLVWAWAGSRSRLAACEALAGAERDLPAEVSLAVGEAGQGIEGWRLTHRQARAAIAVARRAGERRVRYADVALLAAALRDDVLASSLHDIYLGPLEAERDGGEALRDTLHAYLAAGRNVSSAAARLGIARQTVSIRLRAAEEKIGRSLDDCGAEAEVALRLKDLGDQADLTAG